MLDELLVYLSKTSQECLGNPGVSASQLHVHRSPCLSPPWLGGRSAPHGSRFTAEDQLNVPAPPPKALKDVEEMARIALTYQDMSERNYLAACAENPRCVSLRELWSRLAL
jgi:hypothetical protein